MISVVIITKNESLHISRCLQSIEWADEIIVLDSGSDDDTVSLCHQYTDKVFETDWPGFGQQKQRAVDKAQGDWIFSIDADEVVTAELRQEIETAIQHKTAQGFAIPRLSNYCGRQIQHSGWSPDYTIRLFRQGKGRFTDEPVHERVIVEGLVEKLSQPLLHDAFINFEEVLDKVNHYSSLGALKLAQQGKQGSLTKAIYKAVWSFFKTYFIKAGFLDGQQGLMLAISNAEGTYYKYVKLWEIQQQEKSCR